MNSERLHALDAVRGFAMLAGVVLHATLSLLPGFDAFGFPIPDRSSSLTLAVVYYVIHMFRMTTFFVVAGFFGHLLFHRIGPAGFVRNRAMRIVLPFVVGWLVVYPASMVAFLWAAQDGEGVTLARITWPTLQLRQFPLTHLWFLYILTLAYVGTLAARFVVIDTLDRDGRIRRWIDAATRTVIENPIAFVAVPVPSVLSLVFYSPGWHPWLGLPTPDHTFIPPPAAAVGFGTAFLLGWALHRQADLLEVLERRWAFYLAAALAMTAVSLSIIGPRPLADPGFARPALVLYATAYMIGAWAWTFAVIGSALRFFSQRSDVRRYIADSSYWIYLIHSPVLFFLQAAVMDLEWHWSAKFAFILSVALGLLFASYHIFVRHTVIGIVLNGRRYGTSPRQHPAIHPRPSTV